jgi:hypothetical protein
LRDKKRPFKYITNNTFAGAIPIISCYENKIISRGATLLPSFTDPEKETLLCAISGAPGEFYAQARSFVSWLGFFSHLSSVSCFFGLLVY